MSHVPTRALQNSTLEKKCWPGDRRGPHTTTCHRISPVRNVVATLAVARLKARNARPCNSPAPNLAVLLLKALACFKILCYTLSRVLLTHYLS